MEVLAHRHHPGAIPGNRTTFFAGCASARGRVSKTQLTPGGTEAACHFHLGSWQTSNAPALQAGLCGSVTHRLHQFQLRETRPMHREKPHKLLQVGVTPTPATNFKGKRSGCWSVKPVSQKKVGSDEWSITTASHQPSPVAQQERRLPRRSSQSVGGHRLH